MVLISFNLLVVFEEAAEILESHIVAALTKSVQHLILIGKIILYICFSYIC